MSQNQEWSSPSEDDEFAKGGPIRAYHGSPHDFDRFDISKIGTGEGLQAYGHGLYFAGNEGVARSYRDQFSGLNRVILPEETWGDVIMMREAARRYYPGDAEKEGAAVLLGQFMQSEKDPQSAVAKALEHARYFGTTPEAIQHVAQVLHVPAHMYEVALHIDPDHLIDYDKPLAAQSGYVQKKMRALFSRKAIRDGYTAMHAPRADEAQRLYDEGIPGLRYLDGGSRSSGQGTHNYVSFSHDPVEILRKYAQGGLVDGALHADERTGLAKGGSIAPREVNEHGFYSKALDVLLNAKQPRATIADYMNMLRKAGVKKAELDTTGLSDLESKSPHQLITNTDLAGLVRAGLPQLAHHTNGGMEDDIDAWHAKLADFESRLNDTEDHSPEEQALLDEYQRHMDSEPGQTQYANYQRGDGEGVDYTEHLLSYPGHDGPEYRSTHWPEPNVLAHFRANTQYTPSGKRLMHLEELQSDWAQAGRQRGFHNPELDNARAAHEEAQRAFLVSRANVNARFRELKDQIGPEPSANGRGPEWDRAWEDYQHRVRAAQDADPEYRRLSAESEAAQQAFIAARRRHEEARHIGSSEIPRGPYVGATEDWTDLGLKKALIEAHRRGYHGLSLSTGAEQNERWDRDEEEFGGGLGHYYDNVMPSRLLKIARQLDPQAALSHEEVGHPGDEEIYRNPVLHFSPKMQEEIAKGLPMFHRGGDVRHGRPGPDTPTDTGYVYHATNHERAASIAKEGLRPHDPWDYTDQEAWPDGGLEPRVYFTPKAGTAHIFAPEDGEPVLLRAPGKTIGARSERYTGDVYVPHPVDPRHLEMMAEDGTWHPMHRFFSDRDGYASGGLVDYAGERAIQNDYGQPYETPAADRFVDPHWHARLLAMPRPYPSLRDDPLLDNTAGLERMIGKPRMASGGRIKAWHTTYADEPFEDYDWNRLGHTTANNVTDDDPDSWAMTLARLGPWAHETSLAERMHGTALPVEVGGDGVDYPSLEDLYHDVHAHGGIDAFRERMLRHGHGHVRVNDEEFGGHSYVALAPEHFTLRRKGHASGGRIHFDEGGFADNSRPSFSSNLSSYGLSDADNAAIGSAYDNMMGGWAAQGYLNANALGGGAWTNPFTGNTWSVNGQGGVTMNGQPVGGYQGGQSLYGGYEGGGAEQASTGTPFGDAMGVDRSAVVDAAVQQALEQQQPQDPGQQQAEAAAQADAQMAGGTKALLAFDRAGIKPGEDMTAPPDSGLMDKPTFNRWNGFVDDARNTFMESRDQDPEGQLAVAFNPINRARVDYGGIGPGGLDTGGYNDPGADEASNITNQIYGYRQYSWTNPAANEETRSVDVARARAIADRKMAAEPDAAQSAYNAAYGAMFGGESDPTYGAYQYKTLDVHPAWERDAERLAGDPQVVGDHVFYGGQLPGTETQTASLTPMPMERPTFADPAPFPHTPTPIDGYATMPVTSMALGNIVNPAPFPHTPTPETASPGVVRSWANPNSPMDAPASPVGAVDSSPLGPVDGGFRQVPTTRVGAYDGDIGALSPPPGAVRNWANPHGEAAYSPPSSVRDYGTTEDSYGYQPPHTIAQYDDPTTPYSETGKLTERLPGGEDYRPSALSQDDGAYGALQNALRQRAAAMQGSMDGSAEVAGAPSSVPMPIPRPADLGYAQANVPMPPARPADLTAAPAAMAFAAPLPPRRPDSFEQVTGTTLKDTPAWTSFGWRNADAAGESLGISGLNHYLEGGDSYNRLADVPRGRAVEGDASGLGLRDENGQPTDGYDENGNLPAKEGSWLQRHLGIRSNADIDGENKPYMDPLTRQWVDPRWTSTPMGTVAKYGLGLAIAPFSPGLAAAYFGTMMLGDNGNALTRGLDRGASRFGWSGSSPGGAPSQGLFAGSFGSSPSAFSGSGFPSAGSGIAASAGNGNSGGNGYSQARYDTPVATPPKPPQTGSTATAKPTHPPGWDQMADWQRALWEPAAPAYSPWQGSAFG